MWAFPSAIPSNRCPHSQGIMQASSVPFSSLDFRNVMGRYATGVTVMTTRDTQGRPWGITINSFTSVSLEPPLVLFCLERVALSFPAFTQCSRFAVNVLSEGQEQLSVLFASPGPDKWEGIVGDEGGEAPPVLSDCIAYLECSRHAVHDGGDHVILVGRVLSLRAGIEARPLLYFRGNYRGVDGDL